LPAKKTSKTEKKVTASKKGVKKAVATKKIKPIQKKKAGQSEQKTSSIQKKKIGEKKSRNEETGRTDYKPDELVGNEVKEEAANDGELFGNLEENNLDSANIYDEIVSKQIEREIIKSQRKRTAGKDLKKGRKSTDGDKLAGPITDKTIEIPEIISVKEFSEKTGIGAAKVIGELMKNGILANINQQIDFETAQIIASDMGVSVKKKLSAASAEDVFKGDLSFLLKEDDPDDLQSRPPIVVVMGHVDHGKTSILDYIRETSVAAGEAGGITQHIGAYQVEKNGRKITFLDTPGHEAFTAMRARGAKVTDIAILVVAADEGVKPQTIEAIQHAQEAGVPIIVAVNKIDKDGADPDRVKGELAEYNLVPEEWGGKTIMVPVSAKTGQNMQQLLDMVLLTADLENLKGNPNRAAVGTVIEAHLDRNLGPIATIIVNTGTLKIMDNVVIGSTHGRIKIMKDHTGKNLITAGPSTPVLIAGIAATPQSGDIFQVVEHEKAAREKAQNVYSLQEAEILSKRGMSEILSQISSGQMKQLKLVLKADTKGSLEAIKHSLGEIKNEDVGVKIILSGVGNVSESDVMMAAAAGGIVIGFNVGSHSNVKEVAEREKVEIMQYTIIYKLLDDIRKILTGLLEPETIEVILGKAEVKQVFMTKKKEMIIGCKVVDGKIEKVKVRVFRHNEKVGDGMITSLRKVDKQVHEISEGNDCGIMYSGFLPLMPGDILEAYKQEKRIRTL